MIISNFMEECPSCKLRHIASMLQSEDFENISVLCTPEQFDELDELIDYDCFKNVEEYYSENTYLFLVSVVGDTLIIEDLENETGFNYFEADVIVFADEFSELYLDYDCEEFVTFNFDNIDVYSKGCSEC